MKPGMGKQKGSQFERDVCRLLTKWITDKQSPEIFWRSASSGAKSTQDAKVGRDTNMHGDLMAVNLQAEWLMSKYVVECKSYAKLDWGGFIFGKGNIYSWWDKVCGISCDISKSPMLIMKENRCPIRVIMHRSEDIEICLRTSSVEIIKVRTYSRSTVIIFELSDFCNFVDYKAFEKCHT